MSYSTSITLSELADLGVEPGPDLTVKMNLPLAEILKGEIDPNREVTIPVDKLLAMDVYPERIAFTNRAFDPAKPITADNPPLYRMVKAGRAGETMPAIGVGMTFTPLKGGEQVVDIESTGHRGDMVALMRPGIGDKDVSWPMFFGREGAQAYEAVSQRIAQAWADADRESPQETTTLPNVELVLQKTEFRIKDVGKPLAVDAARWLTQLPDRVFRNIVNRHFDKEKSETGVRQRVKVSSLPIMDFMIRKIREDKVSRRKLEYDVNKGLRFQGSMKATELCNLIAATERIDWFPDHRDRILELADKDWADRAIANSAQTTMLNSEPELISSSRQGSPSP